METAARRSDNSVTETLEEQLYAQPYEFNFHQAVRILSSLKPGHHFGEEHHPKEDPVRIRSHISYAVPSSDLHSLQVNHLPDYPPVLSVSFFGIAGIQGPLPQPYTELLSDRLRQKDTAFLDFLDMFNHRLVGYWYRVEKKFIPGLDHISSEKTPIGRSILDLAGFGIPQLSERVHIHNRSLMNYAPLFWQRQKSVAGLQKLLMGYFKCDVSIHEFYGAWRTPPEQDQSRIGVTLGPKGGRHNRLGQSHILGSKSWDNSAGLRIRLRRLSWSTYLKHLPGGRGNDTFRDLVRLYAGLNCILEMRATVNAKEIPPSRLGLGFSLGQTSWITRGKGQGFIEDPDVLLLRERG